MSSRTAEQPDRERPAATPAAGDMGLLEYLTTHTLDEDYAFVSERERRPRSPQLVGRRTGRRCW